MERKLFNLLSSDRKAIWKSFVREFPDLLDDGDIICFTIYTN